LIYIKDAHEFLCQVLDQLKDDADKLNKLEVVETRSMLEAELNNSHLKSIKKMMDERLETALSNPIVDNFQFEVSHQIQCKM
jgi:hypothetical protein